MSATIFGAGVWGNVISGVVSGLILLALTLIGKKVWAELRDAQTEREAAALAGVKAQQDRDEIIGVVRARSDEIMGALAGEPATPFRPATLGLFDRMATVETTLGDLKTQIGTDGGQSIHDVLKELRVEQQRVAAELAGHA